MQKRYLPTPSHAPAPPIRFRYTAVQNLSPRRSHNRILPSFPLRRNLDSSVNRTPAHRRWVHPRRCLFQFRRFWRRIWVKSFPLNGRRDANPAVRRRRRTVLADKRMPWLLIVCLAVLVAVWKRSRRWLSRMQRSLSVAPDEVDLSRIRFVALVLPVDWLWKQNDPFSWQLPSEKALLPAYPELRVFQCLSVEAFVANNDDNFKKLMTEKCLPVTTVFTSSDWARI